MTIIFDGNDFKYELESVVKLFFPAQLFTLLYNQRNADGDLCVARLKKGKENTYLFAFVRIGEKKVRLATHLSNNEIDYKKSCELMLARVLFLCLEKITGIKPCWGLITGVRPVKRVNKMIEDGILEDDIRSELKNKYLVDDKKIDLALITAKSQRNLLRNLDENSFSLYISIPFCPTKCTYCSFISQTVSSAKKLIPQYVECICKEIEYTAKICEELKLKIDTVYFGGGTPTAIKAYELEKIMKAVSRNFDLNKIKEYTVEAGRADTITREKLEIIKQNGAKRISINPQTFSDDVLKVIGRTHSAQDVIDCYNLAREIGFESINMDFIAGLPNDTVDNFKNTIETAIKLNPENITVHTLSIKRAADLNRGDRSFLKNPVAEMIDYSSVRLVEEGYVPYYLYRQKNMLGNLENTGYSKQGFESFYNIYIMEEIQTILAMGAGASTKLVSKEKGIERVFNYKHPLEYINHFDLMIDKKDKIKEFFK